MNSKTTDLIKHDYDYFRKEVESQYHLTEAEKDAHARMAADMHPGHDPSGASAAPVANGTAAGHTAPQIVQQQVLHPATTRALEDIQRHAQAISVSHEALAKRVEEIAARPPVVTKVEVEKPVIVKEPEIREVTVEHHVYAPEVVQAAKDISAYSKNLMPVLDMMMDRKPVIHEVEKPVFAPNVVDAVQSIIDISANIQGLKALLDRPPKVHEITVEKPVIVGHSSGLTLDEVRTVVPTAEEIALAVDKHLPALMERPLKAMMGSVAASMRPEIVKNDVVVYRDAEPKIINTERVIERERIVFKAPTWLYVVNLLLWVFVIVALFARH